METVEADASNLNAGRRPVEVKQLLKEGPVFTKLYRAVMDIKAHFVTNYGETVSGGSLFFKIDVCRLKTAFKASD